MFSQVTRYYHTLRYLQWTQIRYRLLYQIRKFGLHKPIKDVKTVPPAVPLKLTESIVGNVCYLGDNHFQFLNIKHGFKNGIDWNLNQYGKLWTYNLNYFEYLSQSNITKAQGIALIKDFISNEAYIKDGMEPFPISLRLVFWIKFLRKYQINEELINRSLYQQTQRLKNQLEYHLLGNHLLENGFGLLFSACYFGNTNLLKQSQQLISKQLTAQILEDGAHFELSPMYHHIILFRILDSINLLRDHPDKSMVDLLELLVIKASVMLGWMTQMTFLNGDTPRVNDTTSGVAPTAKTLLEYAHKLEVGTKQIPLKESGYRKFLRANYEVLIDVGKIGPDYIPGHAHSDTFNFILHYQRQALIVDTGISTYEKNDRRNQERSTASHNTVMVAAQEQSEVWGGFRVARRANVFRLRESENEVQASHDGYKRINTIHQRTFTFHDQSIWIKDEITSDKSAKAFIHFHPDVRVILKGQQVQASFGHIQFTNHLDIELQNYFYATGFNQTKEAQKVVLHFKGYLNTKITLK